MEEQTSKLRLSADATGYSSLAYLQLGEVEIFGRAVSAGVMPEGKVWLLLHPLCLIVGSVVRRRRSVTRGCA